MSREWTPGDVVYAKWPYLDADHYVMVKGDACGRLWHGPDDHWHSLGGSGWSKSIEAAWPRPLVIIDPEDREQVERLARDLFSLVTGEESFGGQINHMQAALREFASPTPPKPDEPMGLGAVVEDADGCCWVRFTAKTGDWWRNHQGENRRWDKIAAVRVLSEGVSDD